MKGCTQIWNNGVRCAGAYWWRESVGGRLSGRRAGTGRRCEKFRPTAKLRGCSFVAAEAFEVYPESSHPQANLAFGEAKIARGGGQLLQRGEFRKTGLAEMPSPTIAEMAGRGRSPSLVVIIKFGDRQTVNLNAADHVYKPAVLVRHSGCSASEVFSEFPAKCPVPCNPKSAQPIDFGMSISCPSSISMTWHFAHVSTCQDAFDHSFLSRSQSTQKRFPVHFPGCSHCPLSWDKTSLTVNSSPKSPSSCTGSSKLVVVLRPFNCVADPRTSAFEFPVACTSG